MATKNNYPSLPLKIWCKINYWAQIKGIAKDNLAKEMFVHPRTLINYNQHPDNITLGQIDSFLIKNGLEINDLI